MYFQISKCFYHKNTTIRFRMFPAFYYTNLLHTHDFELMGLLIDNFKAYVHQKYQPNFMIS